MTTVVWPHRTNPLLGMMKTADDTTSPRTAMKAAGALRIVMAGGGTGGHLYPGLAVADALREAASAAGRSIELFWAATPRPVDERLLSKFGSHYIRQAVRPLTKSITRLWPFWRGWQQSCSFWSTQFAERKVDCVVALGGYAAGPASYIAHKRGIPVVLLNPDALPGLANRFLLKRSNVVVTQWPLSPAYTKNIPGKVKPLGCPIRHELTARTREEAATLLQLPATRKTLIITGASLGAKTINDAMLALLADPTARKVFSTDWQILHLAGIDQAAAVRDAYAKWPDLQAKVIDYCDDMASVWAIADLAIARAGASTCAELTACGVPSILLPYPFHKDMHQRANAQELMRAGAALIVDDTKDAAFNATAIRKALDSLVYDEAALARMSEAAVIAGKPNAAAEIAKEILALVQASTR